jgi:hypothetical protein
LHVNLNLEKISTTTRDSYQSTHSSRIAIFLKRAGPIRSNQFGFFFPVSILNRY